MNQDDPREEAVAIKEGEHEGERNDLSDHTPIKNWKYFSLFSYLYVLQGVITGIAMTMPYVYPILPSVSTMALFNATQLPFSF
jgi:thiosulfate reductase cytochrome b subunit